jgi:hypothetical protein
MARGRVYSNAAAKQKAYRTRQRAGNPYAKELVAQEHLKAERSIIRATWAVQAACGHVEKALSLTKSVAGDIPYASDLQGVLFGLWSDGERLNRTHDELKALRTKSVTRKIDEPAEGPRTAVPCQSDSWQPARGQ